jgi:glutamate dehydrogenase (NAD(P)+)
MTTEDVFRYCDELGPARVVHIHEAGIGLRAILVVDNTAAGPAIGGVRMASDVSLDECVRLARAMTFKNAAAGLPHGGGKAVIFADPGVAAERKEQLVRAFAHAIGPFADFIVGPDMGTNETAMAWVKDEIGRCVGLPSEVGGIPLDEIGATGFGVAVAAEVAAPFAKVALAGARVTVQGFGSVGKHAARRLIAKGAKIVAVADSRGAVHDARGLDVERLIALKERGGAVTELAGATVLAGDALVDVDCDIWVPAARPDAINEANAHRVRARLVVQGANIGVTEQAERLLRARGVLCLPDFISNAGGVICASVEYHGGTQSQAFVVIEEKIRTNMQAVLERAAQAGVAPRAVAVELAAQRVRRAMQLRRWR